jgi:hypothetical protein
MITFGTYRLSYEPPEGSMDASIDMSITAEANLEEMAEFFTSFLRAAGYPVDYSEVLELTGPEEEVTKSRDGWSVDTTFSSNGFPGYPDESITSVFPGVAVGNPPARNVFF